uniref:Uncharacterized protein n=1 Tax=Strombidinopsis acuminata TaxID=141414 RepID=A0A7S3S5H3_9SPIT
MPGEGQRESLIADRAGPDGAGAMNFDINSVFVVTESPEEAWAMADSKKQASERSGDKRGKALALIKATEALVLMMKLDVAANQVMEAQAICEELKYEEGRAAAMNAMAKIYVASGGDEEDIERGEDLVQDALVIFRKLGNKRGEAATLMTLSGVMAAMQNFEAAIKAAKDAQALFQEIGDRGAVAALYHEISKVHVLKANTSSAIKALLKARAIQIELGDKRKEGECMLAVGKVEAAGRDAAKATAALTTAGELFKEAGDHKGAASAMNVRMDMHLEAKRIVEAVAAAKLVVTINHDAGDLKGEAEGLTKLAEILLNNENVAQAYKLAETAAKIAASVQDRAGIEKAYDMLAKCKNGRLKQEIKESIKTYEGLANYPVDPIIEPGLNKIALEQYFDVVQKGL